MVEKQRSFYLRLQHLCSENDYLLNCPDVRIVKVITVDVSLEDAPASLTRRWYFVLQLFSEQIFSMEPHLEIFLALALAHLRKECCANKEKYIEKYGKIEYEGWNAMLMDTHRRRHKKDKKSKHQRVGSNTLFSPKSQSELIHLEDFWIRRWNQIRECPNERQCVKFDRISDILKRFFMDKTDEVDTETNERKWTISFKEITSIWPNVKELHFMNEYRFDNGVLQRLIDQIKPPSNKRKDNTLRKVVFLYFDYLECDDGSGKPMESDKFMNPEGLDEKLRDKLLKLGWKIEMKAMRPLAAGPSAGYKITVSSQKSATRKSGRRWSLSHLRSLSNNSFTRRFNDI